MYCSTSLTQLPLWPRLPRGLVGLLILSLLFQTILPPTFTSVPILPSLTLLPGRWRPIHSRATHRLFTGRTTGKMWPRLFVRTTLLAILLHLSGWVTANVLTWSVLAIPFAQTLITLDVLRQPTSAHPHWPRAWISCLQRGYQCLFILLTLSPLVQFLSRLHPTPVSVFALLSLSVSATSPDHATEICIERPSDTSSGYHITLRGAFHFSWEPRDGFEKWMLILVLRRLQRVGETRSFLRQHHLAEAFEILPTNISHWTNEVEAYGWHILSDRYRHQIHSV